MLKSAKVVALIALILALTANVFNMFADRELAHRNCVSIELLKDQIRNVLEQDLNATIAGKRDALYIRLYGKEWEEHKARAIRAQASRLDLFQSQTCRYFPFGDG